MRAVLTSLGDQPKIKKHIIAAALPTRAGGLVLEGCWLLHLVWQPLPSVRAGDLSSTLDLAPVTPPTP